MARIYLDNNSTTAAAPEVVDALLPWMDERAANPSSPHPSGERAADAIRAARGQVARLLGGSPSEIVFTSGGTESVNTALHAAAAARPERRRVLLSQVEHSAVKASAERLERGGHVLQWIGVDDQGRLDRGALETHLERASDIALLSLMWANNETGVLTDLEGIGAACRERGVLFHVDAVQAPGKVPVDVARTGCDLLSISGHKFHGPRGVGALWVRAGLALEPLIVGGPQEDERRAGTENLAGIVGLGRAADLAREHAADPAALARVAALRDRLEQRVLAAVEGAQVHGAGAPRVGNTTNIAFGGLDSAALLALLGEAGVEASAGSACNARHTAPSPVLLAMGCSPEAASSSLRLSLSRDTTQGEVDAAAEALAESARTLAALA